MPKGKRGSEAVDEPSKKKQKVQVLESDDEDSTSDSSEADSFSSESESGEELGQVSNSSDTEEEDEDQSSDASDTESDEVQSSNKTAKKGLLKNEEMLPLTKKTKKNKNQSLVNSDEKEGQQKSNKNSKPKSKEGHEKSNKNDQSKSKKSKSKGFVVFVGQIPHHMTKKDIERHFTAIGGLKDVRLLIYQDSGRSRGCAYVEFVDKAHMKLAMKLNESTLGGSKIRVEYPYQGGKKYGGAKNKAEGKNWKKKNF